MYFSLPVIDDSEDYVVDTALGHGFERNVVDYAVRLVVILDEDVVSRDEWLVD